MHIGPNGMSFARMFCLSLALALGGCAGLPRDPSMPISDPYEATNRSVLSANQAVLHPVATVVRSGTPGVARARLLDFNQNLQEPRVFANDILQGRPKSALNTLGRFITNSTIGLGGLVDVASRGGLPPESGDFGQTLFVWGFAAGDYVVLPFFGPSTTRDTAGLIVDMVGDPVGLAVGARFGFAGSAALAGIDAAARVSQLKEAEDASIDFYSFIRSSYYQTRRAELREAIGQSSAIESPAVIGGR